MKLCTVFALAVLAHGEGTAAHASKTAIEKVTEMLRGMQVKGKKTMHEEQVQFAAFLQFCDDTTSEKQERIKEADDLLESLKADLELYKANIEDLEKQMKTHNSDIAEFKQQVSEDREDHEEENSQYARDHQDLTETVTACGEAIKMFKTASADRPQAGALLQRLASLPLLPMHARSAIGTFLETTEDAAVLAPVGEANAYEFQSGDIVTMLQELREKFTEQRTTLEKEHLEKRHGHEMNSFNLQNSIKASEGELSDDIKSIASNRQKVAATQGTLDDTTATRDDDKKYLDDVIGTCTSKKEDYEVRQKLREEEQDAFSQVLDILESDKVSGAAARNLPSMIQPKKAGLFAQLRASGSPPDAQVDAAAYLARVADKFHSPVLSAIAERATNDPFEKVKKLIQELIGRLENEAAEEAEHKAWCDEELGENEKTRTEKTAEVEKLMAEIDGLNSKIAKLGKELIELSEGVADINKAVAEFTEQRQKEQAENEQTIIDAEDGQAAINQAIEVLVDFYGKAGAALVQKGGGRHGGQHSGNGKQEPDFSEGPTQKTEGDNVLSFLDVIKSNFARLEKDAKDAEAAAQSEYDDFMTTSETDKTQKDKDSEHKTTEQHEAEMTVSDRESDLESSQKQLDAAKTYFEKLRPSCLDTGSSFEERTSRRKEEVESLQEALRILEGEELP